MSREPFILSCGGGGLRGEGWSPELSATRGPPDNSFLVQDNTVPPRPQSIEDRL